MIFGRGKIGMNVEGDRLSNLPDDLIHKILSFIGTKHVIQTSALSSRWRYIWTSMPYLNFSSADFHTQAKFSEFVTCVLSGRNNQIEVSSVKVTFSGKVSQEFVKRILNKVLKYAFSHNVQHLNLNTIFCWSANKTESPFTPFSSQSLKHLTLAGFYHKEFITTPSTWKLPALSTLNLHRVTLYDDNTDNSVGLFSNCANLKNLTIKDCRVTGPNGFNICHSGLSDLTLENGYGHVNVVTPQLKNLTTRKWSESSIIAHDLASLHSEGFGLPLRLSSELVHLEKVDICIYPPSDNKANAREIVCLLQRLESVKFLTLNLELIKILCSHVELISHQPSPFANLKSLKIHPKVIPYYDTREEQTQSKVTMCTEVKNYLLGGSPGATFTMVTHEDIRAMNNTKLAQNLITELRKLLERIKASTESQMAKMHEQDKAHVATDMCWKYMSVQIEKEKEKASSIISKVKEIKGLLTKLPASNRAIIQPSFSTLCAEADIVMNKMTDCMKMQCDENQRRLSVFFHEQAATLDPSS